MKKSTKVAICYAAIILSMLFLVVGVDYLPILLCWVPFIIAGYCTLKCRAFVDSLNNIVNNIIPE